MNKIRVRFAPSPTGFPHVGNVRTALFNYLLAKNTGGSFVLRIEDTDRERYVEGSVESIVYALNLLGISPDEGYGFGGEFGPYVQSERLELYDTVAREMVKKGFAYVCDCPEERIEELRAKLREEKKNPMYDRFCRNRNIPYQGISSLKENGQVVRFAAPLEGVTSYKDYLRGTVSFKNDTIDDMVLLKRDGFPTYNFANVIDDHLMNITHVLRGEEFISSTPKHVLLYRSMGWIEPQFIHLPLILGADKKRLSKRHGSVSISDYEKDGILPEAMFNFLSLLGWSPGNNEEILSREETISKFSLEGLSKSPAVFDLKKLEWINSIYVSKLSGLDIYEKSKIFLQAEGIDTEAFDKGYCSKVFEILKTRLPKLSDSAERAKYFFQDPVEYDYTAWEKSVISVPKIDLYLERLHENIKDLTLGTKEDFERCLRDTSKSFEVKPNLLIHALRVSLTGLPAGPGLFEICEVLGVEAVSRRLSKAILKIKQHY
ncbi:glutamate--tRNA ligase [candidate division WOR-3 bacterium]|nr:glutamate--tRNA ligase [candidate division WOR-3 bacterium]